MPKSTAYRAHQPDETGHIAYSREDDAVWRDLVAMQKPAVTRSMAQPWLDGLKRLALPETRVAQCGEVSAVLGATTGWRVEPVPALIPFSRFFAMLADRAFPAASFIRSRADFDYIEEPDIFHEIWGHTPLLTDPRFAAFSEAIGQAGLRADKRDHVWLIRLYWFTIEFGLTRQHGALKALGSGLASSPTELTWCLSEGPATRPFDVLDILRTPYRIDIHQPLYYVLGDIDDLFAAAGCDLIADVAQARSKGLFAPLYAPKPAKTQEAS